MALRNDKPIYSTEWQSYKVDEGYDKMECDIMLKDGTIVVSCYPNADMFLPFGKNPIRSQTRTGAWDSSEVDKIRITPFDKQQIGINNDELYNI